MGLGFTFFAPVFISLGGFILLDNGIRIFVRIAKLKKRGIKTWAEITKIELVKVNAFWDRNRTLNSVYFKFYDLNGNCIESSFFVELSLDVTASSKIEVVYLPETPKNAMSTMSSWARKHAKKLILSAFVFFAFAVLVRVVALYMQ